MYKKFIITASLLILSSTAFAQHQLEQKNLIINSQDKLKVQDFQEQIKRKINTHRNDMDAKKEILEHEKYTLHNNVKLAKENNNGKLSEDEKINFKNQRNLIESKISVLIEQNKQFMTSIDKEREKFFSSLENNKK